MKKKAAPPLGLDAQPLRLEAQMDALLSPHGPPQGAAPQVVSRDAAPAGTQHNSAPFDVAPLGGRLVIFDSGAVEHAVLAASADRVALTVWINT